VCVTCKISDSGAVVGPDMFAAVRAALGDDDPNVVVRPVQCLSVCKRPATVAVTSSDGYTFLFGDLQTGSGTAALVSFVKSYRNSDYGLVPWRERAEVLRKGTVARVPPMRWSPDDGRAPK
jgi:predicted metal-binding protein